MGQLTLAFRDDAETAAAGVEERWEPAPGWDGYEVSDLGRMRSWRKKGGGRLDEPLVLKRHMIHGHVRVGLFAGGKKTMRLERVDKLVLEAFCGTYPADSDFGYGGKVVHLDGDEWNCRIDNLRWKERRRHPTEAEIKQPGERWLPIEGWPGYEVSDWGRVGSWIRGDRFKILKPWIGVKNGYPYVQLCRGDGTHEKFLVQHLVLEAFVGPRPPGTEACHDPDNTRTNCRLDNLKWGTHFENMAHAIQHGSITPAAPIVEPEPILFFDPFIPLEALVPWEVWKEVPGFEDYEVSNYCRVRSYKAGNTGRRSETPNLLTPRWDGRSGRHTIILQVGGGRVKGFNLARLAYMVFSPPESDGLVCRHVNGKSWISNLINLRWGTETENARDKAHHGTLLRGSDHPNAKLTPEKVRELRRRRAAGESRIDLAREFGIHKGYVKLVEEGKRWGHVK